MGVMAPNGRGVAPFWDSLCRGISGIDRISLFDASAYPLAIAGEVKDFRMADHVHGSLNPRRMSRQTQLALAAAQQAILNAGLEPAEIRKDPTVFYLAVGVSTSSFDLFEKGKEQLMARGPQRVNPFMISGGQPHATSSTLVEYLDLPCRSVTMSTACTAGLDAVMDAAERIASGSTDMALAGGADAFVSPLGMAGFWSSGMFPKWDGEPSRASRPFDRDRKGGILSEGAAFLMLERVECAQARGARVLAELAGFGNSVDKPHSEAGSGFPEAMDQALAQACCLPEDIGYVCAHGPSDPVIDRVETASLRKVLGRQAYRIPVSSIKGCTGNPLAAAGPMQLIATVQAFMSGSIPPTANLEYPDPDCDLDYVPGRPRRATPGHALVDLHGLGGRNTCAVVRRATA